MSMSKQNTFPTKLPINKANVKGIMILHKEMPREKYNLVVYLHVVQLILWKRLMEASFRATYSSHIFS